jgi:hypothetical protein
MARLSVKPLRDYLLQVARLPDDAGSVFVGFEPGAASLRGSRMEGGKAGREPTALHISCRAGRTMLLMIR